MILASFVPGPELKLNNGKSRGASHNIVAELKIKVNPIKVDAKALKRG